MLGGIIGAEVVGVEPGLETVQYAKQNYAADNISYINANLEDFVKTAPEFDYVVSRHALEHIDNGLNLALKISYKKRLMVNVPFNEAEGNIHHKVNWIKEKDFVAYPNKEFFYEGLDGVTVIESSDKNPPNSIICISSVNKLGLVKGLFHYPVPAWKPDFLEELGLNAQKNGCASK